MSSKKLPINMPKWVATIYIGSAFIVLPWTVFLDQSLPTHHIFRHWDVAWVGLDIGLIVSMAVAGVLIAKKSLWSIIAAITTGSFLLVDAWFDVMGAHPGIELFEAIVAAIFLEIPMALASFFFSAKVLKKIHDNTPY